MTFWEMYDYLRDLLQIPGETLDLVFALMGQTSEVAESILYYYTGWHSFEGWLEELRDEY